MGLKRYAILGLGAAGYAYFKNKDNRDKAMVAFNDSKVKVTDYIDKAKQSINDYREKDQSKAYDVEDRKMLDEGAQTSVQYFNEKQEKSKENETPNS